MVHRGHKAECGGCSHTTENLLRLRRAQRDAIDAVNDYEEPGPGPEKVCELHRGSGVIESVDLGLHARVVLLREADDFLDISNGVRRLNIFDFPELARVACLPTGTLRNCGTKDVKEVGKMDLRIIANELLQVGTVVRF